VCELDTKPSGRYIQSNMQYSNTPRTTKVAGPYIPTPEYSGSNDPYSQRTWIALYTRFGTWYVKSRKEGKGKPTHSKYSAQSRLKEEGKVYHVLQVQSTVQQATLETGLNLLNQFRFGKA